MYIYINLTTKRHCHSEANAAIVISGSLNQDHTPERKSCLKNLLKTLISHAHVHKNVKLALTTFIEYLLTVCYDEVKLQEFFRVFIFIFKKM